MVRPLEGITVVDLSRILSGPYCTMMLGDLGARVVKVEQPGGDDARHIGPFTDAGSAYFASVNRDKESIVLDLKDQADRQVFEALVDRADVLVENFRPGALDRLGYGWPTLHERWPRLVLTSVSGFGQTGPLRDGGRLRHGRPGHGWRDEHHRPRRRATDACRHLDRRHLRGHVRRLRDRRRAAPAAHDR